jgi:hypothetical protein
MSKLKIFLSFLLIVGNIGFLTASPIVLSQAENIVLANQLEIGINPASYAYDETELQNSSNVKIQTDKMTNITAPLFARYGVTDKIETFLSIPYISSELESATTVGGTTTNTKTKSDDLGDMSLGAKYNFMEISDIKIAGALNLDIPTGNERFMKGLNVKPVLVASKKIGEINANFNIGYDMNGYYNKDNAGNNPSDVIRLGFGADYACCDNLSLVAETTFEMIDKAEQSNVKIAESDGTRNDFIIGGVYKKDNLKTKLGLDLSLGDEKNRTYDYKIILGLTYLIDIK